MHESQLRADLQQYYGIDFDRARAGEHTPYHLACLLVELPSNARVRVAEDSDAFWTLENVISASVVNSINALIYGMSDSRKRGNPPELLGPSWMRRNNKRTLPARSMPVSELIEILNLPRGV